MELCDADGFPLVVTSQEAREMDRRTIDEYGLPGRLLMELAGAGASRQISERLPGSPAAVVVLCGSGGNGGDGYVVARHLQNAGHRVRCVTPVDPADLSGTSATNAQLWEALGGEIRTVGARLPRAVISWLNHAHVVVDGLLGIGQSRPLEGAYQDLVEAANLSERALRIALDVPTGVCADTGSALGTPFRADLTVTFGLSKPGLHQGHGGGAAGQVVVEGVGWPRAAVDAVGSDCRLVSSAAVAAWLPSRPADGHKGTFGHLGVVGGAQGMEGAVSLASLAGLRCGAGLVTCLHLSGERPPGLAPEVLTAPADASPSERIGVLAIGPGLGREANAEEILRALVEDTRPRVFDADALNILAKSGPVSLGEGSVITPHPLEAARLLGTDVESVQGDRVRAARELATRWSTLVVLKGAGSVVVGPEGTAYLLDIADPTLAVAGSGDVLTGLIGGLMATGCGALEAAVTGAAVHGYIGQRLGAASGQMGVLAGELANRIPEMLSDMKSSWNPR